MPGSPQSRCDIRPSLVVEMFIEFPTLVMDMQQASAEATCRAQDEVKHGITRMCPYPCHKVDGVCQLEQDVIKLPPVEQMMDVLCMRSFLSPERECPKPCRLHSEAGRRTCSGPAGLPELPRSIPRGSEKMVKILADLMSVTMVYQHRCQAPGRDHVAQCQEAVPVCHTENHRFVVKNGSGLIDTLGPHAGTISGPGFRGVLQHAVQAMASGKTEQYLDEYLQNNPEAVANITSKALQTLSEYFHEHPTEQPEPVPSTEIPATAAPSTPTQAPATVEDDGSDGNMLSMPDLSKIETFGNPWIIAAGAASLAISCSGIALGALCHAQLQSQVREPLLASGGGGGAELPARDQELESASFSPPPMVQAS